MPAVRQPQPKRMNYRQLPVWVQWALPIVVAVVALTALVLWVHHQTNDVPSEAPVNSPTAVAEQTQQDDALMRQMQAPITAKLKPGLTAPDGLAAAIATWLNRQIKLGKYVGPLTSSTCSAAGGTTARVALKCHLVTANVKYTFYGVVVPATGQINFCQQVVPFVYGTAGVPLSKLCVAS